MFRKLLSRPRRALKILDHRLRPAKRRQALFAMQAMPALHMQIDSALSAAPHLNILLPRLGTKALTGGPNTAIVLAYGVAELGIPVRLIALDEAAPRSSEALWAHIASVVGDSGRPAITFGSAFDAANPIKIGPADIFLATWWTTAYRLKSVLPRMMAREFIYLIQDFEPGFYPWSSKYAQVLETYAMSFRAVINEQLLADYLSSTKFGQFANPEFSAQCTVFEPAVDRRMFYPVDSRSAEKRLLFYTRPSQPRNLFGIGFEALNAALSQPPFLDGDWSLISIGDSSIGTLTFDGGRSLKPAPWLSFKDYAKLIRESDILVCLMLSPHTSYPVLEMAACRGIAVTNTFGTKTRERLTRISPRIIADIPTVDALANCIVHAGNRILGGKDPPADLDLPSDWRAALQDVVTAVDGMFRKPVHPRGSPAELDSRRDLVPTAVQP